MKLRSLVYKGCGIVCVKITNFFCNLWLKFSLWCLDVKFVSITTTGLPFIKVSRNGQMVIGKNLRIHNGIKGNPIGFYQRCTFVVDAGATIRIGDNVGISQSSLVAASDIIIGNNVKIGGGCCVWTTDFHSIDPEIRSSTDDMKFRKSRPVEICDNAFIGAGSIILKGVRIGYNSIVGAGAVVTKSIPDNEIWGGNPACFIRCLESKHKA